MIADIVAKIVEWFIGMLVSLGLKEVEKIEKEHEIEKEAKADMDQLNGAKTDKEKQDALDKTARDTFGS